MSSDYERYHDGWHRTSACVGTLAMDGVPKQWQVIRNTGGGTSECCSVYRLWRAPLCHYSVFATTRFNLHAHPREVYHQINGSLSVGRSEGNWYIEWGVSAIFGAGRGLVIS